MLHSFVKLDNTLHSNCHAVSVLSVSDIKCCSTTLHFACEKQKVHSIGCDEKEGIIDGADEQIKPVELLNCKHRLSEFNKVIQLWLWAFH